ncbi:MAG: tol-pal system protein YbgF [Deltaproteobacteria bacterium]|nr:tol-pal system protein YbgF [Deltaproteobacteria bacterium]
MSMSKFMISVLLGASMFTSISCYGGLNNSDLEKLNAIKIKQQEIAKELSEIKNRIVVLESTGIRKKSKNINEDKVDEPENLPKTRLKPEKVSFVSRDGDLEETLVVMNERRNTSKNRVKLVLRSENYQADSNPSGGGYRNHDGTINPHYIPVVKGNKVLRLGQFHEMKEPSHSRGHLNRNVKRTVRKTKYNGDSGTDYGVDGDRFLYRQGMKWYKSGRYDLALIDFSKLERKFPDSPYVDNALFWQGECYFRKGKFQIAINFYSKVVKRYKRGNKVPDAIFKMGISYYSMGNKGKGRKLVSKLIEMYPNSEVAKRASLWLKKVR